VIPAARYLLSEHLRTRGFVAPTVVLLAGVVVLYAQPPNPVISTAGTVAAFLFAAQCWLSLGLFNSQGTADRQVLVATVGGRRFALARLLAAGALAARTSVLGLSACALLTLPLDLPPVVPTARALTRARSRPVWRASWPPSASSRSPSRWSAPCCGAAANDAGARLRCRSAPAPVAQLDRASVYGTEGQRFESSRARCVETPATAGFRRSGTPPGDAGRVAH
jgi:hypothetical protein